MSSAVTGSGPRPPMMLANVSSSLFPAECDASPLVAFVTLLVSVVNAGLEAERRRRTAEAATQRHPDEHDVVVVGGGTAGCILAARLSEGGVRRVLLLERGGTEPAQARVPGFAIANFKTEMVQNLQAVPESQNCNATGCALQVPRVLGGGSTINGLMYARGSDRDYDQWAELTGDPAWNYTNVLPYFKRAEDNLDIAISWDEEYHSVGGPQKVSWQPYRHPVLHRLAQAYDSLGVPNLLDFNAGQGQLGYSVAQTFTARGERWSAYRSYLRPALRRPNLRVQTFATARRVLFDGQEAGKQPRASGVEYVDAAGQVRVVRAKEVVLAAGTINTPRVLIMSGVGPAAHLKELGVPLVVDLPVGEGLMDHPRSVGLVLACKPPLCEADWEHHQQDLREYTRCRRGPLSGGFLQLTSFHKANLTDDPDDASQGHQPDLQFLFLGNVQVDGTEQCAAGDSWRLNHVTIMPAVLHPRSRGWVRVNASDPWGPPLVNLGYFSDAEQRDLAVMLQGLRFGLSLAKPLAALGLRLDLDPSAVQGCGAEVFGSDSHLACLARRTTATMWHWAGTCRMGRGDGVVDSALRVRGVDGLRVADASVMPSLTSGNTNAPTIMVAERAADLIRRDWH